ncbi:MAG: acetoacetate--CoA ligase, partial [Gemmatimonadaceae bacterium]
MTDQIKTETAQPLWTPTASDIEHARFTSFLNALHAQNVVPAHVTGMHELQRWSVNNSETFWESIWRAANIIATPRADGSLWKDTLLNGTVMTPPHGAQGPH